jgi:hypothetical protein
MSLSQSTGSALLRSLVPAVLLLAFAGCAPANRDQLAQEVLKADPKFSKTLDKHRELVNRIDTFERELALKRTTTEQTIAQLRKDLAAAVEGVKGKTHEARSRMEPERQQLQAALATAAEDLRAKQLQRATLGRSMTQLRKEIKRGGEAWSPEERQRREQDMEQLLADGARVDQEIVSLREHIRLLKIKLLLIKL